METGGDVSISIFDPFGFRIPKEERDQKALDTLKAKKDNARLVKWLKSMDKLYPQAMNKARKLKHKVRKGIPACLRGRVWPILASIPRFKADNPISFNTLVGQESSFVDAIAKDVHRTYPDHQFFAIKGGLGQKSLSDILKALSLTFKEMGYCQGLNFIAGLLAMYCDDEQAYWMMCSLLKQYNLIEFYQDPSRLKRTFYVLSELVASHYPKLSKHLVTHFYVTYLKLLQKEHEVTPLLFATRWFLTLYTCVLPFGLVTRIFDVYLFENFKVIYRVALAILKIKQAALLEADDIDPIMRNLSTFDEPIFNDEDAFCKIAFGIKLRRKDIRKLEKRYFSLNTN